VETNQWVNHSITNDDNNDNDNDNGIDEGVDTKNSNSKSPMNNNQEDRKRPETSLYHSVSASSSPLVYSDAISVSAPDNPAIARRGSILSFYWFRLKQALLHSHSRWYSAINSIYARGQIQLRHQVTGPAETFFRIAQDIFITNYEGTVRPLEDFIGSLQFRMRQDWDARLSAPASVFYMVAKAVHLIARAGKSAGRNLSNSLQKNNPKITRTARTALDDLINRWEEILEVLETALNSYIPKTHRYNLSGSAQLNLTFNACTSHTATTTVEYPSSFKGDSTDGFLEGATNQKEEKKETKSGERIQRKERKDRKKEHWTYRGDEHKTRNNNNNNNNNVDDDDDDVNDGTDDEQTDEVPPSPAARDHGNKNVKHNGDDDEDEDCIFMMEMEM
jgi:hypothetical protein